MQKIVLSIYNKDFTAAEKTVEAKMTVIPFGAVRKLMSLFSTENIEDTKAIANIILKSWDSLIEILDRVFPLTDDEWDRVDTAELVRCVLVLIQYSTAQILTIPTEKN